MNEQQWIEEQQKKTPEEVETTLCELCDKEIKTDVDKRKIRILKLLKKHKNRIFCLSPWVIAGLTFLSILTGLWLIEEFVWMFWYE